MYKKRPALTDFCCLPLLGPHTQPFSKLEKLYLTGNSLPEIAFPPAGSCSGGDSSGGGTGADVGEGQGLAALRVLSVANNKIGGLSSVRALRQLPVLAEVRMQGNPVCEAVGASAFRQLLISLVSGGRASRRERERQGKSGREGVGKRQRREDGREGV